MADYFVLDWDAGATIVGHIVDSSARSLANRLIRGRPLAADLTGAGLEVRVEVAPQAGYPDYFTLQQVPIVSERLLSALRPFSQSFEVFPAPIVQRTGVVNGHSVLNIVGRVACLDRIASELTFIDDDSDVILRIRKLMLDETKLDEFDISRLHDFEPLVLASTQVRRALDGLTGVAILPANGWSDSSWY